MSTWNCGLKAKLICKPIELSNQNAKSNFFGFYEIVELFSNTNNLSFYSAKIVFKLLFSVFMIFIIVFDFSYSFIKT